MMTTGASRVDRALNRSVPVRLTAFVAVLAVAFGGAALVGGAVAPAVHDSPTGREPAGAHESQGHADAMAGMEREGADAEGSGGGQPGASGLAASDAGFTLEPQRTHFSRGRAERFSFRIVDRRGRAVRDGYELESEREMHLIVVRRDTALYRHLHPRRDAGGTWSVELSLPAGGVYRAYADFVIAGRKRVLATDLFVPGSFEPRPLPDRATDASAGGYQVSLETGAPRAGAASDLSFAVTRDARPVTDLERYLGASGHLVALRTGDLAYLHVHPEREGTRHAIGFRAEFPTAGSYRLFLQFKHGGSVRTVAYTLRVPR